MRQELVQRAQEPKQLTLATKRQRNNKNKQRKVDFISVYAKNLFTVRSKKGEYVASKTLAVFVCGAMFAFGLGAISKVVLKKTSLV